ncbi:hypothetical protein V4C56_32350 [Paraburkholderia azotifigens]|uniref:Copper-binding protein n=2 Tax=Paraburkholderia azotifigens TaxID=2057004 RepID=A0ABU9RB71_9BURK
MNVQWPCRSLVCMIALLSGIGATIDAAGQDQATDVEQSKPFSGTSVTRTRAIVFGIDTTRNSMTLMQESGEPIDILVDPSIGDVSTLKTGDAVSITYSRALLLRAGKTPTDGIRERIDSGFSTAQSVESSLSMHRVQAVATVEKIDRTNRLLTLRDPTRTLTLEASSEGLLNGLKVGDSVRVDFVEATAIRISPGAAPPH